MERGKRNPFPAKRPVATGMFEKSGSAPLKVPGGMPAKAAKAAMSKERAEPSKIGGSPKAAVAAAKSRKRAEGSL